MNDFVDVLVEDDSVGALTRRSVERHHAALGRAEVDTRYVGRLPVIERLERLESAVVSKRNDDERLALRRGDDLREERDEQRAKPFESFGDGARAFFARVAIDDEVRARDALPLRLFGSAPAQGKARE